MDFKVPKEKSVCLRAPNKQVKPQKSTSLPVLGMTSTYGQGDIYNSTVSFRFKSK